MITRNWSRAAKLAGLAFALVVGACSSDDGGPAPGSGGYPGAGGAVSTGAVPGSGAALGGGGLSSGGFQSSGGFVSSGGLSSSGGSGGAGGVASGGAGGLTSGGAGGSGGSVPDGGGDPDASAGGSSSGGTGSGGTSSGGTSSGGTSSGGASSGGTSSGGTSSGGTSSGGTSSGGTSSGGTSSGGTSSGGASSGGTGGYTAPGYTDLAPPMGQPLDPDGSTALTPPPPDGYKWYPIAGTQCRDGSGAGIFVKTTASSKLVIYLEGGGACSNGGFCGFNPANVNQVLSGDGERVIGSAFGAVAGRQQPGVYTGGTLSGIFDGANTANPFRDWNVVYVPYCTGDVHFGTKKNAAVPGLAAPQQFVGYLNMRAFISRIVPTFKDKVDRVILTGASAGGFGAALNYSMVQDSFTTAKVDVLDDSGPPFNDTYMPVCLQKRWREAWGFGDALPPDCTACRQADGGGILKLADFLLAKHPQGKIALISSMEDEVIRLFFSIGQQNCLNYDTANPVAIVLGQLDPNIYVPAAQYTGGLNALRTQYGTTGRFGTYYMGGANVSVHQHTFRSRFYQSAAGNKTIAAFVSDFVNGTVSTVGP